MSKKYYLIKTDTSFYDGHGCPDDGGSTLEVVYTDEYDGLDLSKVYTEDLEVFEEGDDNDWSAEDSYNCQREFLTIKEITKEEYFKFSDIINNYDTLLNSL